MTDPTLAAFAFIAIVFAAIAAMRIVLRLVLFAPVFVAELARGDAPEAPLAEAAPPAERGRRPSPARYPPTSRLAA